VNADHTVHQGVGAGLATPASALFNPGYGRAIYGGLRYRM